MSLPSSNIRLFLGVGTTLLLAAFLCVDSVAQSLDPQHPGPMLSGKNTGTVDNMGGPNYFYFWAGPGESTITVTYKSMGLLGNAMKSDLNVELYDEHKTWVSRATISSLKESNQRQLHGTLKTETKLILAIIPPSGGLVRTGGDYEVSATGAVRFDKPLSSTDLIVGTYTPKTIYNDENSAVKFKPDGTLEFASGTLGKWKVFDEDMHIYTVTFLNNRFSLKLMPGRGLVNASDPSDVVFQRAR
jgi:hypothetical protein